MLRTLSWGSFGGLFLMISPKLRLQVLGCLDSGVQSMDASAPYSYIGAGLLVVLVFLISLSRGTQPTV
jgi:hypothetical protein